MLSTCMAAWGFWLGNWNWWPVLISVCSWFSCVCWESSSLTNWSCTDRLLTPAVEMPMTPVMPMPMVGAYNWTSVLSRSFKVEIYFAEAW